MFHVELKYTSHGPRLIEVNCRMGGGPVRATNLLVWGVDLVEEQLLCSAGIPSRPPIAPKPLMYIAEYSVNAKVSGRIMNIDFCKVRAPSDLLRPAGDAEARNAWLKLGVRPGRSGKITQMCCTFGRW